MTMPLLSPTNLDAMSSAIDHLVRARDEALDGAVAEGCRLIEVATLLGVVPPELHVPAQIDGILEMLEIGTEQERHEVRTRLTHMFAAHQRTSSGH